MEWKQTTLFEQTHHLIINRIFLNSRVKRSPLCRHELHNEFIRHSNVLTVNARIYTLSRAHETRMQSQKTFLPYLILFHGCSVSKKSIEPLKSTPEMGIPFLWTLMDHVQFSREPFVNLHISSWNYLTHAEISLQS